MLRMRSSARSRLAVALAATLALTSATVSTATLAHASPQDELASEQQKAAQLESQIETNGNRVSVLDEQYNQAQAAIEQATAKINADERELKAKQRKTDEVRDQLSARAAELYMGAGNPAPLAALDVTNATELGSRAAYGGAAADQDRQLLDRVKVAIEQLGIQKTSLEQARAAATKQRDQLDEARREIARATEEQLALLSQVKGSIKTLVDEIQVEKERAAEAQARAAIEQAQQKAQEQALAAEQQRQAQAQASDNSNDSSGSSSGSSSGGSSGGSSGNPDVSDPNLPAPSNQAQVAIDTAKAQLGKPYVYAGSGPSTFDCSGLTQYAWAAAGVSMSHNAEAQYNSFPHVAMSELQPGDLVFFGAPIHHVGMFVGGGTMIEAPYTGVNVRYRSIYRHDYAGAARP